MTMRSVNGVTTNPENSGAVQERKPHPTRFKPGQSGNPAGKPVGARHKLSECFLKAMLAKFERDGVAILDQAATEDPIGFVKVWASLVPKELEIGGTGNPIQGVVRVEFVRVDQIEGKVG